MVGDEEVIKVRVYVELRAQGKEHRAQNQVCAVRCSVCNDKKTQRGKVPFSAEVS